MKTIIKKINKENLDTKTLLEAASILSKGGLVAFPTETVYGLGANALDDKAASKIYTAKGRPSDNPLIVHIGEFSKLDAIVQEVSLKAKKLGDEFWPGPLTMVFNKNNIIPYTITGGLDTVAVRMPSHLVARELINVSGIYIAAPSANISGRPSPTSAKHVISDMEGKVDMIIDGGDVSLGIESTIIDMTSSIPTILRPGCITKEMIEKVIGTVKIDPSCIDPSGLTNQVAKAPGMKYKHYAPKGELLIVEGDMNKVCETINNMSKVKEKEGYKIGILASKETEVQYEYGIVKVIGTRENELSITKALYGLLREFDDLEVDYIYSESFSEGYLGQAIMNRLLKAAGYKRMKL